MSNPLVAYVYNQTDNVNSFRLKADGVYQDLSSVTRMAVIAIDGSFTIDSEDSSSSGVFNWNTGTTGKFNLVLGQQGIVAGSYECFIVTYDPTNDDGIVWGTVLFKFKDATS